MLGLKSSKVTATGNVTSGPARLIAIHAICAGSAGSIVLKMQVVVQHFLILTHLHQLQQS